MALIGTIRKNSWLLIIFIGMGLALFIITSMFVGNQIPFLGSQTLTGSVNGQDIEWNEMTKAEEAFKGSRDIYSTRNYVWNFLVEEALVKKEADALGFTVSEEEQEELLFGNNPHPKIRQFFTDPNTGQFNQEQFTQARTVLKSGDAVNPNFLASWTQQKKEVIKEQLQTRINNLVTKSIFTPTWMVEQAHVDQSQTATFEFVKIPYDEIDNSEVTIEEADLKAYLADHQKTYYQDKPTRRLDYVVFKVEPSKEDTLSLRMEFEEMVEAFRTTDNDTIFIDTRDGIMDSKYFSREDINGRTILTDAIADKLFDAPTGAVIGPVIDGNQMKIAKLLDRRVFPDSATSRHILLSATTPQEFAAAQVRIDSFKNVIESGAASFDSLAMRFSQDPGSAAKGGLYENVAVNSFVAEYNDIIFFKGEIGKLYAVKSNYGIHLIEPISRKYTDDSEGTDRVKIAVISKPIVPGDVTQDEARNMAQDFMADNRGIENFTKAAAAKGLNVESSAPLTANDFLIGTLGSGSTSRDIVRWAFNGNTSVGDVAPEVFEYQDPIEYHTDKLIVVALKATYKEGTQGLASVREDIEPLVYNQKKAEIIKSRISSQNLSAIASTFSAKVDTASNVTFNSGFVNTLGNEPEVIAMAFNLDNNAVSTPIAGNTGVFVVKMNTKSTVGAPSNIPTLRRQTSQVTQTKIAGSLLQSMKKSADIKDLRAKFY